MVPAKVFPATKIRQPPRYVAHFPKITVAQLCFVRDFPLFFRKRPPVVARQNPRCIAFECAYYRRRYVLSYFIKSFRQDVVSTTDTVSVGYGSGTITFYTQTCSVVSFAVCSSALTHANTACFPFRPVRSAKIVSTV